VREVTVALTVLALVWAGAAFGVWWVLRRRRPLVALATGLAAIGAASFASLLAMAVVGRLGAGRLGMFGAIHGFYLAAVLSVPLFGAAVLVATLVGSGPGERRSPTVVLGSLLVVPGLLGLYATHIAPFQLRIDDVDATVSPERDGHDTIRIAVLADIQTTAVGDLEREAVRAAMAADPDIVLIPGDVLQVDGEELAAAAPAMQQLLSQLHAPGGVYLVGGDSESPERLAAVRPPSVRLLEDEVVTTTVGDRTVAIGGTLLAYDSPAAQRMKDELMAQDPGTVRILLSHRPDTVLGLPADADIDLTVAGHTHGGQIALPVIGPLITLTNVPRTVAAGGLHEVAGNQIYVSPGIGMERGHAPQIRFLVPPTVGIVDLG
jgi:predicted MPP superfamily phosphohydrolase